MSRLAAKPIQIPEGVKVELKGDQLKFSGPKGELELEVNPVVKVEVKDNQISVDQAKKTRFARAMQGTTFSLIKNKIEGVKEGFSKKLVIEGVGYRVNVQGKNLVFSLGFKHDITVETPENLEVTAEDQNSLVISGLEKQEVGQFAARIRALKKPDVYKGKGIRYADEEIKLKEVKTAVAET